MSMTEIQKNQRIAELRARLQSCYCMHIATELMRLELLPPAKAGPIGVDSCPLCGSRGGPHEHSAAEQVIYRNGMRAGRASVASVTDQEIGEP